MLGEMSFTAADLSILSGLLVTLVTANWAMTRHLVRAQEKRTDELRKDVDELRRDMTPKYDWTREAMATRKSMESIAAKLNHIDGKIDGQFGVGAAIGRVADAVEKWSKRDGE